MAAVTDGTESLDDIFHKVLQPRRPYPLDVVRANTSRFRANVINALAP
jgi:hypothetical protein